MRIAPQKEGQFYMHVYTITGESTTELANSPVQVNIVISEIHKLMLQQKELDEEQLRLERLRLEELNKEKQRKKEEQKRLAKLSKEDEI